MPSLVLNALTARPVSLTWQTDRQTDRQTNKPSDEHTCKISKKFWQVISAFLYAPVHTSILCRSVPKLDESTTCRHLKSPQSPYPVPDSKVHGAYMGPTGPRWVPWTLLYGMDPNTSHWSPKGHGHEWLTHIILFNVYWPSHSWDIAYQNLTLKIWGQGHGLHQIEWPH